MSNYDINWEQYLLPDHWWKLNEASGTSFADDGKVGGFPGIDVGGVSPGSLSKTGRGTKFNGSGDDYINCGRPTQLIPEKLKAFTISCWWRHDSSIGNKGIISWDGASDRAWFVAMNADSAVGFGVSSDGTTTAATANGLAPLVALNWYHMIFIWDGSTIYHYRNAVLQSTDDFSGTLHDSAHNLELGRFAEQTGREPNGVLSDVRFYADRSLSAQEVKQLYDYTNNYRNQTVPIIHKPTHDKYTKLYCTFDGDLHDESESGHIVSPLGTTVELSSTESKFGEKSLYIANGGTGWCNIPYRPDFDFEDGDFTIDVWINKTSKTSQERVISRYPDNAGNYRMWRIFVHSTGHAYATLNSNGEPGGDVGLESTTDIIDSQWHHIAFVRAGNTLRLFIDGIQEDTDTFTGAMYNNTNYGVNIGRRDSGSWPLITCYIADVRISKGIARWTSNFTPPTVKYEPTRYINLHRNRQDLLTKWPTHWWKLNETIGVIAIDYGLNNIVGNNTNIILAQEGNRQHNCYAFNGSTSDVDVDVPTMDNGVISMWFKATPGDSGCLFGMGVDSTQHNGLYVGNITGTYDDDSLGWTGNAGLAMWVRKGHTFYQDNRWHHIVAIVDAIDNRLIVDGVRMPISFEVGNSTSTSKFIPATHSINVAIGRRFYSSEVRFTGCIQDVQIYEPGLTDAEAYRIYKYGLPTNALGDYCAQNFPELLEREQIKAVHQNRFNGAILPEKSRSVNPDEAIIIQPGDF